MSEPDFYRYKSVLTDEPMSYSRLESCLYGLAEATRPLRGGMINGQVSPQARCEQLLAEACSMLEVAFRKAAARNPRRTLRWLGLPHGVPLPVEPWTAIARSIPAPPRIALEALDTNLRAALERLLHSVSRFPRLYRLEAPATDAQIDDAEEELRWRIPAELRSLWRFANGMHLLDGSVLFLPVEKAGVFPSRAPDPTNPMPVFDMPRDKGMLTVDSEGVWRYVPTSTKKRKTSGPLATSVSGLLVQIFDRENPTTGAFLGLARPRAHRSPSPPRQA